MLGKGQGVGSPRERGPVRVWGGVCEMERRADRWFGQPGALSKGGSKVKGVCGGGISNSILHPSPFKAGWDPAELQTQPQLDVQADQDIESQTQ